MKDAKKLQDAVEKANLKTASTKPTESTDEGFKFGGRVIPLQSPKLHDAFTRVNELLDQIEESKANKTDTRTTIDLQLKVANLLDDTLLQV